MAQSNARAQNKPAPELRMYFRANRDVAPTIHPGRQNQPVVTEVAIIFQDDQGAPPDIDFMIKSRSDRKLITLSHLSPNIAPMCFPILFPFGEQGWQVGQKHNGRRRTEQRDKITCKDFAKYRLAVRTYVDQDGQWHNFHHLHLCGKLFKQYILDLYIQIESNNLSYIRSNQTEMLQQMYSGLLDFVHTQAALYNNTVGRVVILPATYNGMLLLN